MADGRVYATLDDLQAIMDTSNLTPETAERILLWCSSQVDAYLQAAVPDPTPPVVTKVVVELARLLILDRGYAGESIGDYSYTAKGAQEAASILAQLDPLKQDLRRRLPRFYVV